MVKTFRVGLAEPNSAIEKFTNKNVIPKKRKMERNEKNKTVQIIKKKSIMATQSLKLQFETIVILIICDFMLYKKNEAKIVQQMECQVKSNHIMLLLLSINNISM